MKSLILTIVIFCSHSQAHEKHFLIKNPQAIAELESYKKRYMEMFELAKKNKTVAEDYIQKYNSCIGNKKSSDASSESLSLFDYFSANQGLLFFDYYFPATTELL